MSPTPAQCTKMAEQWNACNQDAFIETLYQNMFKSHPEWRSLFKKCSGDPTASDANWKKQFDVTKAALDGAVNAAAKDQAGMKSTLHALAERHKGYGVTQTQFQALKEVIGTTAKTVSGADMDAWGAVSGFVLDNIV